jgi:hypothetical protein
VEEEAERKRREREEDERLREEEEIRYTLTCYAMKCYVVLRYLILCYERERRKIEEEAYITLRNVILHYVTLRYRGT